MLSSVDKILETSADHDDGGNNDQDDDVDEDGDDDPGVRPGLAVNEQVPVFGEVLPVYIRGGAFPGPALDSLRVMARIVGRHNH